MGAFSLWHWLVLLLVVILIFGTRKLKDIGSDLGAAIKNFKGAVKDDGDADAPETPAAQPATTPAPFNAIEYNSVTPAPSATRAHSAPMPESTPPAPAQMVYVEPQPVSESPLHSATARLARAGTRASLHVVARSKLKRCSTRGAPKATRAAAPKRPTNGRQPNQRSTGSRARIVSAHKA